MLGQPVLGDADRATMRATKAVLERHGAWFVPTAAASTWEEQRFALPYRAVRSADSPDDALYAFLDSSYAAAADLAGWDRDALERERGFRPVPRWPG